jgi:5-methylcytosine-specific restriction endonuclease McrA
MQSNNVGVKIMSNIMTQRKVLVLNRGWNPIAVVNLEKAMCLVASTYKNDEPKARIMDPVTDFKLWTWADWAELIPAKDEAVIRSAKASFRIPEIILLSRYNKLPQQRVHFSRRTIYKRDGNQCQYCGDKPGTFELSIDHILPRCKGGKTEWTNTCICCVKCNRKKADKTMAEARMTFFNPNYKPKKPKFTFYKSDYRCKSWESILGISYWLTELENDMNEAE